MVALCFRFRPRCLAPLHGGDRDHQSSFCPSVIHRTIIMPASLGRHLGRVASSKPSESQWNLIHQCKYRSSDDINTCKSCLETLKGDSWLSSSAPTTKGRCVQLLAAGGRKRNTPMSRLEPSSPAQSRAENTKKKQPTEKSAAHYLL